MGIALHSMAAALDAIAASVIDQGQFTRDPCQPNPWAPTMFRVDVTQYLVVARVRVHLGAWDFMSRLVPLTEPTGSARATGA